MAIRLLDDSDLVFNSRHADGVGAFAKLFLGDAFGQGIVPD
jgi:hypothetical protein